jgi:hypothetical protein
MRVRFVVVVGALAAGAWMAGADRAPAQDDRWQFRGAALGARATRGEGSGTDLGFGLGLEYRLSPRLGIEVGALTVESEQRDGIDLFIASVTFESSYRITPLLARLNVHLTPDQGVDLYAGPVVGYVDVSDMMLRTSVRGVFVGEEFDDVVELRLEADDELAWGAAIGLDVPLGRGGSAVTFGVTYLSLPLSVDFGIEGEDVPVGEFGVFEDVDPLLVHVGYSVRF